MSNNDDINYGPQLTRTTAEALDHLLEVPPPTMVEEDAKNRCQHSKAFSANQCRYETLQGQTYCRYHAPLYLKEYRKKNQLRKYNLICQHARVSELVANPEARNLAEEIGILEHTLEVLMNQCHTPWDVQVNQHKIESLVEKIAKTMTMAHKLQAAMGQVLDQQSLATFVDKIVKAISDNVTDPTALKNIGTAVAVAMQEAKAESSATAIEKEANRGQQR